MVHGDGYSRRLPTEIFRCRHQQSELLEAAGLVFFKKDELSPRLCVGSFPKSGVQSRHSYLHYRLSIY